MWNYAGRSAFGSAPAQPATRTACVPRPGQADIAGYVLYVVTANVAAIGDIGRPLALTPLWLVVILWLTPAVAALGLGALVLVSARVRGFQEAYQLGGLIVLPIVLLMVAQLSGVLFLDAAMALLIGALVWLAAGTVLWLGFRSFRRERLLLST